MGKLKIITIISVILLIIIGVWYFRFRETPIEAEKVAVEYVVVKKTISGNGIVKSENDSDLSFASAGIITNIPKAENEDVRKNETLGSLNVYSSSQTAQSLKDSRDIALRERDLFLELYQNDKDEAGGEEQYDIKLRQLNEQISKAEATYKSQLGTLTNSYIKAPFAGKIIDVYKKVGEVASPGEPILRLADTNNLYFEIEIDQEDFGNLKVDMPVDIYLDSYEDHILKGKIVTLPQYTVKDGSDEIFKIKVEVVEPDKDVLIGMTGDAEIIINESNGEVQALQFDMIYEDQSGSYIWVVDDKNTLSKKYITLGLEGDVYTEITDDLTNQTIVVPVNTEEDDLSGMKVKFK